MLVFKFAPDVWEQKAMAAAQKAYFSAPGLPPSEHAENLVENVPLHLLLYYAWRGAKDCVDVQSRLHHQESVEMVEEEKGKKE